MFISKHLLCMLIFSTLLLSLVFMGCGDSNIFEDMADDNTKEAQLEEAQIALDKGDYTTAVDILLGLCGLSAENPASGAQTCDNNTISLLASAYMGRAGLDLINLIDLASQIQTEGAEGTFTEFSQLLLNGSEEDASNAVALLSNIQGRTEEQNLQLAVAAAADTILIISDITGLSSDGLPTNVPTSFDQSTLDAIENNLIQISTGIAGSGLASTSDLTSDITTIQTSIDANGDTQVLSEELNGYLCIINPTASGCP